MDAEGSELPLIHTQGYKVAGSLVPLRSSWLGSVVCVEYVRNFTYSAPIGRLFSHSATAAVSIAICFSLRRVPHSRPIDVMRVNVT